MNESELMTQLADHSFTMLRRMDDEATSQRDYKGNSFPTGLRAYGEHDRAIRGISTSRYDWERATGTKLGELLRSCVPGISTFPQQRYPRSNRIADLRLTIAGVDIWLEIKAGLKYDREVPSKYLANGWFRKHLTSVTENSASNDFHKLVAELTGLPRVFGGVLLLGFDYSGDKLLCISEKDIDDMKRNGNVDHTWAEFYREWGDVHQAGDVARHGLRGRFRVRCWLWLKKMGIAETVQ